ncbi:MAG: hypothetical protein ACLTDV_03685 [Eubacterium sp.]
MQILATLTSKIIATMMYNDTAIDEVVATIAKTSPSCLPMSGVFNLAHSGLYHTENIAEYDNPNAF